MGFFASFAFHARYRHGSNRCADHGKAQDRVENRWKCGLGAGLASVFLSGIAAADTLRVAYFHSELSRNGPGLLLRDILRGDEQVEAWSRVVARVDPDILVVGDIDFDLKGHALTALAETLGDYPHRFARRPNRGRDSARDLDGNGRFGEAADSVGYAEFAGQGGMAVLSKLPIDHEGVVDFTGYRWGDLPDALALGGGRDPDPLSTTVHWDVPVFTPSGLRLHLLMWHATAPVFDGPEDRNGRRNHDETRFWHLYVQDRLEKKSPRDFVILGTANADPFDGESRPEALNALLKDHRVHNPRLISRGGPEAATRDAGINASHRGDPAFDTVDWPERPGYPGNLRVDYVLPAAHLTVRDGGVFWPTSESPLADDAARASRHRLIWVDIDFTPKMYRKGN